MNLIKQALDEFLESEDGNSPEQLEALLSVLAGYAAKIETKISRFNLQKMPDFESKKKFLHSKISEHQDSLKNHCGSHRVYTALMKMDPDMTGMSLIEDHDDAILLKWKNFGQASLNSLKSWVYKFSGYKIGQKVDAGFK